MTKIIPDTHHISDPVHTKLQEVIFELFDNKNVRIPMGGPNKSLEDEETEFITLGELAEQLCEVELDVFGVEEENTKNHSLDYGDNTSCDCCGDVFDARNSNHLVIKDKWICNSCTDMDDDKIADRLGMSESEVSEITTNY